MDLDGSVLANVSVQNIYLDHYCPISILVTYVVIAVDL